MGRSAKLVGKLFSNNHIRHAILSHLDPSDVAFLRRVSILFCKKVTPTAFKTLTVTFRPLTFDSARLVALERIGHHIKKFRFVFPHTEETYMPPMLDPRSRKLVNLVFKPHARLGKHKGGPIFGSKRMDDLVLQNYGILMIAAADIRSFTEALKMMPNITNLTVCCPGIPMGEPGRRCIIDYALWSLRVAIERSGLQGLRSLHLEPMHMTGLQYFLPGTMSLGSKIDGHKAWANVRSLTMNISAWRPIAKARNGSMYVANLKFLHQYMEYFKFVRKLKFAWTSEARGVCPLTLDNLLYPPGNSIQQRRAGPNRELNFNKLCKLSLTNVAADATALKAFLCRHVSTFRQWSLNDVYFVNGTLEDALAPVKVTAVKDEHSELMQRAEEGGDQGYQLLCPYCHTGFEALLMV
ncbi:hypothetical protein BDZ91DRAFT_747296 [Kalaharituber pfeilii]|nr:hypothetical protein BDZ91DRAFT_747296 [Kalaharituber pfeilii]